MHEAMELKNERIFIYLAWERKDWIHIVEIVILMILNLWAYTQYYSRFFFYPMIICASISDERSVMDAYDGTPVFITMRMEGEF